MDGVTIRWTPQQQRAIDCIACQHGLPVRRVYLDRVTASPRPRRFNTRGLATKLSQSLRTEAP